jgi:hypothetical protein
MDNFTTFTNAYQQTGNTMMLSEEAINDSNVEAWAKNFSMLDEPTLQKLLAPTPAADDGTSLKSQALTKRGEALSLQDKVGYGANEAAGQNQVHSNGNPYMNTDLTSWKFLIDYVLKNKDLLDAGSEKMPGDDIGTTGFEPGMDPTGSPEENEKALRVASDKLCDDYAKACKDIMDDIDAKLNQSELPEKAQGIEGCENSHTESGSKTVATNMCNSMLGLNSKGKLNSYALLASEGLTVEEIIANAEQLNAQRIALLQVSHKIVQNNFKLEDLTDDDLELLACLKMRGGGQSQGVWISGGEGCDGVIATQATGEGLTGDQRYGVMLGNQNSALYRACKAAQQREFEVGEGDNKHNLIKQGGDESGLIAWYNATYGRINEHLLGVALAIRDGNREKAQHHLKNALKELGGSAGFRKMVDVVGHKLDDPELEFEFGTLVDKGAHTKAEEFLEFVEENGIKVGDDKDRAMKVAAYLIAQAEKSYKEFVESLPEGVDVEQVGRDRAGGDDEGNMDNADAIISFAGGLKEEEEYLDSITVNPLYAVTEEQCPGRDDGRGLGASIKNATADNRSTALGSRGVARTGEESAAKIRESVKCYAAAVCENHEKAGEDCGLESGWEEREAEYRADTENFVNETMGAIGTASLSQIQKQQQDRAKQLSFKNSTAEKEFNDLVLEYKAAKGTPQEANLEAKLRNRMEIAKQARDVENNVPGAREKMLVDTLYTGGSTRDQMYLGTATEGATRVARESDLIGKAAFMLLKEDIHFTQQGYGIKGVGVFNMRVKGANEDGVGGTNKQFVTLESGYVYDNTRPPPSRKPSVGNSAMKAEDFVRQLQELLQGIDKIFPVQN